MSRPKSDYELDQELGMTREITRRDFLNGVAVGAGATLLGGSFGTEQLLAAAMLDEYAPEKSPEYYPPEKTGMRGNHDGTFTFAHKLRDSGSSDSLGDAIDTGVVSSLARPGANVTGFSSLAGELEAKRCNVREVNERSA